jgi:hypothetical protein
MLFGLDKGRSAAMNQFVKQSGFEATVYAVCCQLWLLLSFPFLAGGVTAYILGARTHAAALASIWLFAIGGVAWSLCVLRLTSVFRLRAHHKRVIDSRG